MIALFWSFANDAYTQEQGERLFPIVTVGMTAGPVVGSKLSDVLVEQEFVGVYDMLQVAAAMLLVHGILYALLLRRPDIQLEANDEKEESALRGGVQGLQPRLPEQLHPLDRAAPDPAQPGQHHR